MKVPKKFRIAGLDWTVKYDGDVARQGHIYGSTHYETQTIFINPDVPKQKQEQTFLHELMHVVGWHFGVTKMVTDEQEEQIVNAMASGLYHVLKDNGLLK